MNRRRSDKSKRVRASDVVARRKGYLIIDGYNLMHVTRFKPVSNDAGELRRCREGLLALLADRLSEKQYREITIVFDSEQAPKHLPDHQQWRHLQVIFARNENSADDLIAKLVQQHPQSRDLVVVSSDHRVQNAASRRRSVALDADEWFDAVLDFVPPQYETERESPDPPPQLSPEDMSEFLAEMNRPKSDSSEVVSSPKKTTSSKGTDSNEEEFENPFPDDYFDGLDDE